MRQKESRSPQAQILGYQLRCPWCNGVGKLPCTTCRGAELRAKLDQADRNLEQMQDLVSMFKMGYTLTEGNPYNLLTQI